MAPASDKALRAGLIRLAHANPEFRKDILPLLKEADFPPDSIGDQVSGPTGIPGSDAKKPWAKGEFTQQEFTELDKKQESGKLSDGKADGVGKSAASYDAETVASMLFRVMQRTLEKRRPLTMLEFRELDIPIAIVAELSGYRMDQGTDSRMAKTRR